MDQEKNIAVFASGTGSNARKIVEYFKDNDERAIFFARGVLETVRKLRWSPDIVHCHGWITALLPLYLRKAYQDDPLYNHSKIVYSIYNDEFKEPLQARFKDKLMMEGIEDKDVSILEKPTFENLTKLALEMSDAAIFGSKDVNKQMADYIKKLNKPVLEYKSEEEYIEAYSEFYDEIPTTPVDEN